MKTHDFLLELGTEELPPKLLKSLSESLKSNIIDELKQINISSDSVIAFATPRRLAITISKLQSKQKDQVIEKKGHTKDSPEMPINGFAKYCEVDLIQL
jgi:glycyl-tRNA synthetase beta chain